MRNYFIFDNTDSRDFGVCISGSGVYDAPGRTYEEIAVPGRDGIILGYNKRLENINVMYPAFIYANFSENMALLRSFLLSKIGYQRLEDSYHPDEYRLAVFRDAIEAEPTALLDAGQFELNFFCKPQRFLKLGEQKTTFTSNGTITNPTECTAKPLIRIYGNGTVGIGHSQITLANTSDYTDVDCDIMEAYNGTNSRNANITLQDNDFPTLAAGENGITLGTGITRVEIIPRWWRV